MNKVSPVQLYAVFSPVGKMARWLPSVDEAKRVYTEHVERVARENGEPVPAITFEVSCFDDVGDPCPEHVECLIDGRMDCCIWPERAAWPEEDWHTYEGIVKAPKVVMLVSKALVPGCQHPMLMCSNAASDKDAAWRTAPQISCADCGGVWSPAGFLP